MSETEVKKIGTGSYIIAGLGFIPLIGVLFAFIAIILGLVKLKNGGKRLIVLGCFGIALTVGLYSVLFYQGFMVRGGIYDELRGKLAKSTITDLVKSIEYYKVTKGQYPNTLLELQSSLGKESFTLIYDPTYAQGFYSKEAPTFFYQLTDDRMHYYLLGVGADQKPFTGDDILPDLPEQDRTKTGLLIKTSEPN